MPTLAPATAIPAPETSNSNAGGRAWQTHSFFFWFSIAGTVTSLIGFFLSVYFYQESQIKPLLTFGVHPLKTELQRPDYDKDLGFIYKGTPLDSESITSVQLSIWNAGNRSIRESDVLEPFRLVMPDGSPILSVRVKKTSRPICGFESVSNQEDYKLGVCRLKWRILEPGDGAVIQVIYAGTARRDPKLEGAVEGQQAGIVVQGYSLNATKTGIEESISHRHFWPAVSLILCGAVLVVVATRIHSNTAAIKKLHQEYTEAAKRLAELQRKTARASPVIWVLCAFALVFILAGLALIAVFITRPGPPFGW